MLTWILILYRIYFIPLLILFLLLDWPSTNLKIRWPTTQQTQQHPKQKWGGQVVQIKLIIIMSINITKTNNPQDKQCDDFTMRDDVIQFSHDMVASARNRYRKKSHSRSNHNNSSTQMPLSTPRTKDILPQNNNLLGKTEVDLGIDLKTNQIFTHAKRNSFTTRNNVRYRDSNPIKIPKTQSVQIDKIDKVSPLRIHNETPSEMNFNTKSSMQFRDLFQGAHHNSETSFKRIDKRHKKNDLKQGGVQSWLNQALIQASPNLQIDKKDENGGLKAYLIDRSQLLKIGIHPEDVNRLYRSFFVYSVGFNHFLKQLCGSNTDLRKLVWKVYALLLQYCSEGHFQTMIGEIQRDKQIKLMQMKREVENRQKIIEKSDQINEKKNAKIMKQIRQLQQKTKDLQSQRQVIKQDLREAQQSFNEQISLRLKYEARINQIHGVYEQLNQKHRMLKQEHTKNLAKIQTQQQLISSLRDQLFSANAKIGQHQHTLTNIEIEKNVLYDTLAALQKTSKETGINYLSVKSQSQNYAFVLSQKKRAVQQLQLTVKNMQSTQKAMMQTIKNKNMEFELAMKQNAQLHQHVHDNSVTINRLTQQMRSLGHKTTQIAAQMAVETRKLQQKQHTLRQANTKINQLKQELEIKQLDLTAEIQKKQSLQQQISKMNTDIKEMKMKHNELSYLLDDANKNIKLLQDSIEEKKDEEDKYIQQIQKLKTKIQQLKVQIKQKQSKIAILQENIKGSNQVWQLKHAKANEQLNRLKEKSDKFQKQRSEMVNEIFSCKQKYEKIFVQFKNEKFERNNLDLYYKQSLAVMEEEIEHIKKLNIQISQLSEQNQQSRRKYNNLQLIHKHRTELLEKDLQFWRQKAESMEQKAKQKRQYVHPFKHEDVCGKLMRSHQSYQQISQKLYKCQKRLKELEVQRIRIIHESQNKERKTNNQAQKSLKNEILKRQGQITFLKQKMEYQSIKLSESDQTINKMNKQKNAIADMLRKTQTQSMSKLNQRNLQLRQSNDKYRSILHLNQTQLKQHQNTVEKYEVERKQLIAKIEELSSKLKHGNNNYEQLKYKQNKRLLKPQYAQKLKTKKVTEQRQPGQDLLQSGTHDNPSAWADEQEQENVNKHEQLQKQLNSLKEAEQQKLKQREGMRNKIKGAYLYYLK